MNKVMKTFQYLTRDMPLNDFNEYDEYWKMRKFKSPAAIKRAEAISKFISKDKNILDIGCGDGSVMEYIKKNNFPKFIYGVDKSSASIKYIREKDLNGEVMDILHENNLQNLLKKYSFHYIIITEVLEHIYNPEYIMQKIKEFSPSSIIFVSIPNSGFILHRLRLLFGKFPIVLIQFHIKEHIRFWTNSDFKYWTDYLGFNIKNIFISHSIKFLGINFSRLSYSLFAEQIIYELNTKK